MGKPRSHKYRPRKHPNNKMSKAQRLRRAREGIERLKNYAIQVEKWQNEFKALIESGAVPDPSLAAEVSGTAHDPSVAQGISGAAQDSSIAQGVSVAQGPSITQEVSGVAKDLSVAQGLSSAVRGFSVAQGVSSASRGFSVAQGVSSASRGFSVAQKVAGFAPRSKRIQTKQLKPQKPSIVYAVRIRGRRIIDVEFFLKALKDLNKHSNSGCNLNDMVVVQEQRAGLLCCFHVKCTMCKFKKVIWSEDPKDTSKNVNADAVAGMLNISGGFGDMHELFTKLTIPPLTRCLFSREYKKISEEWEKNPQQASTEQESETLAVPEKGRTVERVELGGLLVETEIEIEEGRDDAEPDDSPETILPDREIEVVVNKDSMIVEQDDQTEFNGIVIKEEIDTDVEEDEGLTVESDAASSRTVKHEMEKAVDKERGILECDVKSEGTFAAADEVFHCKIKSNAIAAAQGASTAVDGEIGVLQYKEKSNGIADIPETSTVAVEERGSFQGHVNPGGIVTVPGISTLAVDERGFFQGQINPSGIVAVPGTSMGAIGGGGFFQYPIPPTGMIVVPGASTALDQSRAAHQPGPESHRGILPLADAYATWTDSFYPRNNSSFFTLPGGAPKGFINSSISNSAMGRLSGQPKQRFRCYDCDLTFAKYESLESHRKTYCIKRLKVLPSSTVTSQMNAMIDEATSTRIHPCVRALNSAMADKRSALEASVMSALNAQNAISLHKVAQQKKAKAFKELDDAFNRENALAPNASPRDLQRAAHARAQAASRAQATFMHESYAAATVEQALYKQKTAIEAAVAATAREQTAAILVVKALKEQENNTTSIIQTQHAGVFNQEKGVSTANAKTAVHQQAAVDVAKTATFFREQSSTSGSSKVITKSRHKSRTPSASDRLQKSLTGGYSYPKKNVNMAAPISDESKTASALATFRKHTSAYVELCKNSLQPQGIVSLSKEALHENNVASASGIQSNTLPHNCHPEIMDLSASSSHENSLALTRGIQQDKLPHDCPQEMVDLSATISLGKSVDLTLQQNKLSQDCSEEMMEFSATVSHENNKSSTHGIEQYSLPRGNPKPEMMDLSIADLGLDNAHLSSPSSQQQTLPH